VRGGRSGVDSALAARQRIRSKYGGQMAFDLSEYPMNDLADRLRGAQRTADAIAILEANAREFPSSSNVAYQLGRTYEIAGDRDRAIVQYRRLLVIEPTHAGAQRHLRALTDSVKPPPVPERNR
jgi:tetratricopeptide (TPR) repeat protein